MRLCSPSGRVTSIAARCGPRLDNLPVLVRPLDGERLFRILRVQVPRLPGTRPIFVKHELVQRRTRAVAERCVRRPAPSSLAASQQRGGGVDRGADDPVRECAAMLVCGLKTGRRSAINHRQTTGRQLLDVVFLTITFDEPRALRGSRIEHDQGRFQPVVSTCSAQRRRPAAMSAS